MSQFIIIHCKDGNEPVAINADYILTIYTGETGTTITTRQNQIVWCTETMDEIMQMIEAVAGHPTHNDVGELIRCKECKHFHEYAFREDEWILCRLTNLYTDGDKYCAWAERRTE